MERQAPGNNEVRVFIVEDEILIRRYIVDVLTYQGCTVVGETSYGEDAVKFANSTSLDLILMDICLRGQMDGIEAARLISQKSNTPILFMSAYDYIEEVASEELSNCIGYLNKPVEEYDLEKFILPFLVP